ncbi:MAG TPA: NAD(P)-dependent oxidoreductase [Bacteroidota bacterium]|nr:NAD(P)-dependent oxidoreductase [Bacteroidota bacterium]
MTVLIADSLPQHYVDAVSSLGVSVRYQPKLKSEELASAIGDAGILVVRSTEVNSECISNAANLSLIIRAGAGVNTIDMKAANARGIYVSNCPGKNSIAVAELTMGLLLAIDRRIVENVNDLRAGAWNKTEYSKADGLYGKTIGIIGMGQIGKEVVARARAFGLRVVAYSRSLRPEKAEALDAAFAPSIETLVSQCDIISIHLALTPETKQIISRDIIARMRHGAIVLNTSRWEVIDEEALYDAAAAGKIRVGADVFSGEPEDKSTTFTNKLGSLPTVYGTHHIGASTEQAQNAVAAEVVTIIKEYKELGTVRNWVNRAKTTAAKWQLVVRHYDKPGVLANVLEQLKSAHINVQEIENVIFEGQQTACCTLKLDAEPSIETVARIQNKNDEVIQASMVAL